MRSQQAHKGSVQFNNIPKDVTYIVEEQDYSGAEYTATYEGDKSGTIANRLTNCFPLGISNELTGQAARISLEEGSAWIFLPLSELKGISYAGESFIK